MKKITKFILSLFCMILFLSSFNIIVQAKEILPKPTINIYVQDYANMLSADAKNNLLKQAELTAQNSGPQICIVTIDTLDGESINNYANKLFRAWGIGQKDKDNGVLFLLSKNDSKVRIEVGRGLEDVLPDIKCSQIIDSIREPYKNDDYDNAITMAFNGINTAIKNTTSTPSSKSTTESVSPDDIFGFSTGLILLVAIIMVICIKLKKKNNISSQSTSKDIKSTLNSKVNSNVGFHKEYNLNKNNLNSNVVKGPTIIIKNNKPSSSNYRKNPTQTKRTSTSSNYISSNYSSSCDDSSKIYINPSYDSPSYDTSSTFGGGSSDGGGCSGDL